MPADAKLYLSPVKWENQDLVDMIHVTVQKVFGNTPLPNIRMGSTGYGNHLFMDYNFKGGPGMLMLHDSDVGGIPARMISGSANNEKKTHFLRKMAETYGGVLMENEGDGTLEEFENPFLEEEDFLLKTIQKRGSSYDALNQPHRINEDIDDMIERLKKMKVPTENPEDE